MRWVTIGIMLVSALGCRLVNENHCANLAGDETCLDRDEQRRYCSACTADHDGCVAEPVNEPACAVASSASTGSSESSSTTAAATSLSSSSSSSGEDPAETMASTTMDASSETTAPASSTGPQPGECGDGVAENEERCDGQDLAGNTCANQPEFAGGDIACNADCELDTSKCNPCRNALALCVDDDQCCSRSCADLGVCD